MTEWFNAIRHDATTVESVGGGKGEAGRTAAIPERGEAASAPCHSIEEAFGNLGAGADDIDLILATDAEQILGIGDWGVGGIEISIGKLAIYTAAGGIDPTRVIPVMLDAGTNRESLLGDPCTRETGMRGSPTIWAIACAIIR